MSGLRQLECIISEIEFAIQPDLVEFARSKGWSDKEIAYLNVFGDEKFQDAEILLTSELLEDLGGKKATEDSLKDFIRRQYVPHKKIVMLKSVSRNSPIVKRYSYRADLPDRNYGNRKKFYVTNGIGLLYGLNLLGTEESIEIAKTGFKSMNLLKEYNRYVNSSKDKQIELLQQNYMKLRLKHNKTKNEISELTKSVNSLQLSNTTLRMNYEMVSKKIEEGNKRLSTAMLPASNPTHTQVITILKIILTNGSVLFKILRTQKRGVAPCIRSCKKVLRDRDLDVHSIKIWGQVDDVQNSVELNTSVLNNLVSLYKHWFDEGYQQTYGSASNGLLYYFIPDTNSEEGAKTIMDLISNQHEYITREL